MATQYFALPDQYNGKTLNQIRDSGVSFRPDLLGQQLGVSEYTPLKAGQNFSIDPGSDTGLSQALNSFLVPGKSPTDQMFDQQKGQVTDYLGRLGTGVTGNIQKANSDFGVPELSSAANALKTRIDSLRTNAFNDASGYAGQGQVNGALDQMGTQYAIKSQAAQGAQQLANNEFNQMMIPLSTEGSMLTDRLTRESTGYSQDQQRQLDELLAKMQQGSALTLQQQQNANQLAMAEQNYANQLQIAQLQHKYIPTSMYGSIFNTQTGQFAGGGGGSGGLDLSGTPDLSQFYTP